LAKPSAATLTGVALDEVCRSFRIGPLARDAPSCCSTVHVECWGSVVQMTT
jgi:hypothetical protein